MIRKSLAGLMLVSLTATVQAGDRLLEMKDLKNKYVIGGAIAGGIGTVGLAVALYNAYASQQDFTTFGDFMKHIGEEINNGTILANYPLIAAAAGLTIAGGATAVGTIASTAYAHTNFAQTKAWSRAVKAKPFTSQAEFEALADNDKAVYIALVEDARGLDNVIKGFADSSDADAKAIANKINIVKAIFEGQAQNAAAKQKAAENAVKAINEEAKFKDQNGKLKPFDTLEADQVAAIALVKTALDAGVDVAAFTTAAGQNKAAIDFFTAAQAEIKRQAASKKQQEEEALKKQEEADIKKQEEEKLKEEEARQQAETAKTEAATKALNKINESFSTDGKIAGFDTLLDDLKTAAKTAVKDVDAEAFKTAAGTNAEAVKFFEAAQAALVADAAANKESEALAAKKLTAQKAVDEATKTLTDAETLATTKATEAQTATQAFEAKNTELATLNQKVENLKTQVSTAETKANEAKSTNETAQNAVTNAKDAATEDQKKAAADAKSALELAEKAVTDFKAELKTAEDAVTTAKTEAEALKLAAETAATAKTQAEKAMTDAQEAKTTAETELAKFTSAV